MHIKTRKKRRLNTQINVVPYIDAMLVLLIVFMLTAPVLEKGVDVDLPASGQGQILDFSSIEPLIITVDKQGKFSTNIDEREGISSNVLLNLVQAQLSIQSETPIFVRGDKEASYGQVVELIALLQVVGVSNVGLATDSR